MQAICIARHKILAEHIGTVFADGGITCRPVVGFAQGMQAARELCPQLVICDYDMLVAAPIRDWETDPVLSRIPIIAVSLTRRPDEAHLVDCNGFAGFLYLPMVNRDSLIRVVQAAAAPVRSPADAYRWPADRVETPSAD
jgi:CheY-like chemotaxis protein